MALSWKHIGSCATGTTHYYVPRNGHIFYQRIGSLAVLFSQMTLFSMENQF